MCELRKVKKSQVNTLYDIQVRARPVQHPVAKYFATHCYLVLLDQSCEVVDSLSFDPSNSIGWCDADPGNHSRGSRVVHRNCEMPTWEDLSAEFKRHAVRKLYVLGNHNCCHAVMDALVATNLTDAREGIHFARVANNTWGNVNQNLDSESFIKKNI